MSRNQIFSSFKGAAICGGLFLCLCVISCSPPPCWMRTQVQDGNYGQMEQNVDGPEMATLPWTGVLDKSMTVDRKTGRVHISYLREGKRIVETWRMKMPGID